MIPLSLPRLEKSFPYVPVIPYGPSQKNTPYLG